MIGRNIIIAGLLMTAAFSAVAVTANHAFGPGEIITYSIKKYGFKAGEASLMFRGSVLWQKQEAVLMTFKAAALNFYDEEKIYADPQTHLPLRVERDLNLWGKRERITEDYLQQQGTVRITKVAGGKTTHQTIQKKGPIDNIYCFIYRYRRQGQFKIGETLTMNLPTQDVMIRLISKTSIGAAGKNYEAYYMESRPKKYRLWFDAGLQKIPLRIDGSIGMGGAALIMNEYQAGEKDQEMPRTQVPKTGQEK